MLREFCRESGLVIAAGGGAVTTPENRDIMRQNSTVVFIKENLNISIHRIGLFPKQREQNRSTANGQDFMKAGVTYQYKTGIRLKPLRR